jgi:hypothetical protein
MKLKITEAVAYYGQYLQANLILSLKCGAVVAVAVAHVVACKDGQAVVDHTQ